ncbi:MAG: hypothetical protein JW852_08080, partial [Spirochaetales bacterium]|nr:hypothetical protein [Spirochaetales bacterium]
MRLYIAFDYRIPVIFLVLLLAGCSGKNDDGNSRLKDPSGNRADVPVAEQYDIPYEVEHTHVDSVTSPLDVYTVVIYRDATDTVKLAKYISKNDTFYYLSLTYIGREDRFMSGAVVMDIDGFISEYRDYDPYRGEMSDGTIVKTITAMLNKFMTNDMMAAVNMRVQFEPEAPLTITEAGLDNIRRFISEME